MARADLEWALGEFNDRDRRARYAEARDYYDGRHPYFFDDARFTSRFAKLLRRLRANACSVVVDVLTERLELTGFSFGDVPPDRRSRELWTRGRFDVVCNEVHREAFKLGDGYAIVEPGPDGRAVVWHERAERVRVEYDERVPGRIRRAAKRWRATDGSVRLNLYFDDRIEKYATRGPTRLRPAAPKGVRGNEFEPLRLGPDEAGRDGVVPWEWGRVPVFHFPNAALDEYGQSEISVDLIGIQDGINKLLVDALTTGEFGAFKQRYAVGVAPRFDELGIPRPPFNVGIETLLMAEDKDAKFGVLEASELEPYLGGVDKLFRHVSRLSGIPLHYLYETTGDYPSGDALKASEARFTKKLRDRQVGFGPRWEELFTFALRVDGARGRRTGPTSVWEPAVPQSRAELLEGLLLEKALGVPERFLWRKAGYSQDEIDEMLAQQDDGAAGDGAGDEGVVLPVRNGRIRVDRREFAAE